MEQICHSKLNLQMQVTSQDVGHYGGSVALADYCPYIQVFHFSNPYSFTQAFGQEPIYYISKLSLPLSSGILLFLPLIHKAPSEHFVDNLHIHNLRPLYSGLLLFQPLIHYTPPNIWSRRFICRSSHGEATMLLYEEAIVCMKRTNQVSIFLYNSVFL